MGDVCDEIREIDQATQQRDSSKTGGESPQPADKKLERTASGCSPETLGITRNVSGR